MKGKSLSKNIRIATKWSTITEFVAKMFVPVTNMILARLLTPDAFGVIATVILIISFADMLSDSGFQKYLIQRDFKTHKEKIESINVAFWTNISISILLWLLIVVFQENIAILVGNPGLGMVIAIAGISLPLTSFSSIQMSIYRRDLDFKTLFHVRLVGVLIPFFITIPLALLGLSYWSLVIGMVSGHLANAILLTIKSYWKPTLFYKFSVLKRMLSFSLWSLAEAISIWATTYIGVFIVSGELNNYYLGLFQTTMVTVNGILAIITTATTSVLFSSLSRLQNNEDEYLKVFLKFMRFIGMIVLPMGVGIFIYRNLLTDILLGEQWQEASLFVGLWGLISSITIVFGQYCSEIYRSKGRPRLSLLVQILYLLGLLPTIMITAKYGYTSLIYGQSLIKIHQILVNWLVVYIAFKISPVMMVKNLLPPIFCSILMGGLPSF
ncbi:lipopolysaccharide biosynthesis protein [Guptibacillus hwajinpoensis]|uniref:lipopolysaccharide biosynthesis protein n=1 Tax=Guptibacillus hwajinpoensis TaxID=208199 RepID=UPI0024B388FF|nr:lipopolysaccharide biosynthesis protein [Pseudalkalibacillus hwajinpoensis]